MATLIQITDKLISLIQSEYPRFKDPERIKLDQDIELENLGYEDTILVRTLPVNTQVNLTAGKISTYDFEIIYYKKLYKDKIGTVSTFAESLDAYLLENVHNANYWTHLDTVIDYDIDVPEDYKGKLSGFVMTITFLTYCLSLAYIQTGMPVGLLMGITYG